MRQLALHSSCSSNGPNTLHNHRERLRGASFEALPNTAPACSSRWGLAGEVDPNRRSDDVGIRDEPPVATIIAIVSVITEQEVVIARNHQRTPIVAGGLIRLRRRPGGEQILPLPQHVLGSRIILRIYLPDVRFDLSSPVDEESLAPHLQRVAGQADGAAHEAVAMRMMRHDCLPARDCFAPAR
jgi:hypothetical protein